MPGRRTVLLLALLALLGGSVGPILPAANAADCSGGSTTVRISVANGGGEANGRSELPAVNADGCVVAFKSAASNLIAADQNGLIDVFVRDRRAGTTVRIPPAPDTGTDPNGVSYPPALDAAGTLIAFGSEANNLVRGDFNTFPDLFVYDQTLGTTSILTLVLDAFGQGRGGGRVPDQPPSVSADGTLVAFTSSASDLIASDANEANDVFVRNRGTGTLELISVSSVGGQAHSGNGPSAGGAISGDGCTVVFYSDATNLVAGDTNRARDVFARDRCAGTTELVSVSSGGALANASSQRADDLPAVSADGRFVAFDSDATNLDPLDTNGVTDVFLRDRQAKTTRLLSQSAGGAPGNGPSRSPSISADGRFVVFQSAASNLVDADTNGFSDIFVVDTTTGNIQRVSVTNSGQEADGDSFAPRISADATTVVYQSDAANLVAGDTNAVSDIFASINTLAAPPSPTASPTPSPMVTPTTPSGQTPTGSPTPTASFTPSTPSATSATPAPTSPTPQPTTPAPSGSPSPTPTPKPSGSAVSTGTSTPVLTATHPTATPTSRSTETPTHAGTPTGGGGGGGCSCRIAPDGKPAAPDAHALLALAVPVVLLARRSLRRRPRGQGRV